MAPNQQSQISINKKKFKFHKKKRAVQRNNKKVHAIDTGTVKVLRKHRPSKKKMAKDTKRRRIFVEAEKAKLLKSGVITQEDIDKMEAENGDAAADSDEEAEGMETDN